MVIFLDIDGVITSARTGWMNMDIYAINFLRWVCKCSGAKVVISSTWRYDHPQEFWLPIWEEFLHPDWNTPALAANWGNNKYEGVKRGSEIQKWLDRHPGTHYLILDDDADMLPEQKPNFIQCDSMNGLQFEQMQVIRDFFQIKEFPKDKKLHQHPNMFNDRMPVEIEYAPAII